MEYHRYFIFRDFSVSKYSVFVLQNRQYRFRRRYCRAISSAKCGVISGTDSKQAHRYVSSEILCPIFRIVPRDF